VRRLKNYFVTGFLIVAPISITVFLFITFVRLIDGFMGPVAATFVGKNLPGIGFGAALLVIFLVGFLASNLVGRYILEWFEDLLLHIPVFNWLYRTIKQLTEVFSPASGMHFKSVVMIEYPRPGVWSVGFVTKEVGFVPKAGGRQQLFSVYVPTNHVYVGDVVLVPQEKLIETQLTMQEGLQVFLSAGASFPEEIIEGRATEKE
jgi:uncharacterized membrane protein